jgi:hypothetical protein
MKIRLITFILVFTELALIAHSGFGQGIPVDLKGKVDAIVNSAYLAASAEFPCKIKAQGNSKMLLRKDVDRCLNAAYDRVDWENLSRQMQSLCRNNRVSWMDLAATVDSSLAAYAISYDKIFIVKIKDAKALLPLSNSVLKFLPDNSLQDLPVFSRKGEKVGAFAGVYTYDKTGELAAANNYRLSVFQYADSDGNIHVPPSANRLLLDRYGVPWNDAMSQPGFRLISEKLLPQN